jgi:hypothetical protein
MQGEGERWRDPELLAKTVAVGLDLLDPTVAGDDATRPQDRRIGALAAGSDRICAGPMIMWIFWVS